MRVSGIITVFSLFFVELNEAAPVDKSAASRIVKIDERGVEEIDFNFVEESLGAMYERHRTGGESLIMEKEEKEFIDKLIEKVQKRDMIDEFLSVVVRASQFKGNEPMIGAEKRSSEGVWRSASPQDVKDMVGTAIDISGGVIEAIGDAYESAMKQCIFLAKPGMWHSASSYCRSKPSLEGDKLSTGSSKDSDNELSYYSDSELSYDSDSESSECSCPVSSSSKMNQYSNSTSDSPKEGFGLLKLDSGSLALDSALKNVIEAIPSDVELESFLGSLFSFIGI